MCFSVANGGYFRVESPSRWGHCISCGMLRSLVVSKQFMCLLLNWLNGFLSSSCSSLQNKQQYNLQEWPRVWSRPFKVQVLSYKPWIWVLRMRKKFLFRYSWLWSVRIGEREREKNLEIDKVGKLN